MPNPDKTMIGTLGRCHFISTAIPVPFMPDIQ
jgi:hypothetical protein